MTRKPDQVGPGLDLEQSGMQRVMGPRGIPHLSSNWGCFPFLCVMELKLSMCDSPHSALKSEGGPPQRQLPPLLVTFLMAPTAMAPLTLTCGHLWSEESSEHCSHVASLLPQIHGPVSVQKPLHQPLSNYSQRSITTEPAPCSPHTSPSNISLSG